MLLESKRNVGPMELIWTFSCKLIPNSSPKNASNFDSEEFVDSGTVLYTHFILPHLLVTSAYNHQIEMLHNYIKSKEERFNETVRLMSLMRLETSGKSNNNTDQFPQNSVLSETLSYTSSAPSPSALENLPMSQLATIKLPSLSDTQLTNLFTQHKDPQFPSSLDDPLYVSQTEVTHDAAAEVEGLSGFTSHAARSRANTNPDGMTRGIGKSKV
ncbi:34195_t:CDS:2, partial [Racocetra persica]